MATIKSYTDINQSKKLAKVLPIESADMYFIGHQSIINPKEWKYGAISKVSGKYIDFDDKRIFGPCWSLAALLSVLPGGYVIVKNYHSFYYVESRDHSKSTNIFDNPIDACYEMIIKLHELNLL